MELIPNNDGVDHINVFTKGKTKLGRNLTNISNLSIDMGVLGTFASMEALWFYGRIKMQGLMTHGIKEEIRVMRGWDAKRAMSDFPFKDISEVLTVDAEDTFKELIKSGLRKKLEQHHWLRKELKRSTLPLAHYYYYGKGDKVVVRDAGHKWVITYLEELRSILQGKSHVN